MITVPTRAAVLTPLAPAGVAVVELIGPDAVATLNRVFRPLRESAGPLPPGSWSADRLRLGRIMDGEQVIDDAIVAVRTDADGVGRVEFTTHGGPRIVQRLLLILKRCGATIVSAADIAPDAWLADTAVEREVYQWLPHALTRRAAVWLLHQRELLPAAVNEIKGLLREAPAVARERIATLLATFAPAARMLHGFSGAIVGPPNAGKSTLANALCGKPRVLVSDMPGTTRDYISEPVAIEGVPVTLIDTAGLRNTDDAIEAEAVVRTRRQAVEADLRLLVLDASVPPTEESRGILAEFTPDCPSLLILNKADLPVLVRPDEFPPDWSSAAVTISAANGDGMEGLRHRIVGLMGLAPDFDCRAAVFTDRQAGLLNSALLAGPDKAERPAGCLDELVGVGKSRDMGG